MLNYPAALFGPETVTTNTDCPSQAGLSSANWPSCVWCCERIVFHTCTSLMYHSGTCITSVFMSLYMQPLLPSMYTSTGGREGSANPHAYYQIRNCWKSVVGLAICLRELGTTLLLRSNNDVLIKVITLQGFSYSNSGFLRQFHVRVHLPKVLQWTIYHYDVIGGKGRH